MGYANTIGSSGIQFSSEYVAELIMTTVGAANVVTFTAPIPAFDGIVTYANIRFKVNRLKNTNAATNQLDSFVVDVSDDNIHFHNAINIVNPLLPIAGSSQGYGEFTILDTTDISAYIPNNGTFYIKITSGTIAHLDTILLDSCYFTINLFFK